MDYTFALGGPHPDLSGAISLAWVHLRRALLQKILADAIMALGTLLGLHRMVKNLKSPLSIAGLYIAAIRLGGYQAS